MEIAALIVNITPFLGACALSAALTPLVRCLAIRWNVIDEPGTLPRKQHTRPVPLLGGVAIFATFTMAIIVDIIFGGDILSSSLTVRQLLLFWLASLIIVIGGVVDDRYNLPAKIQIIFPTMAALVVIVAGLGIFKVTNPFGGFFQIEWWQPITFVWLLGMTYTTKLLDGVDGLATGITAIGALMIALLALTTTYFQPDVARLAVLFAGALVGFLIWNFAPASIYLGESGSELCGFVLGTLAVVSGSKIATALLVMGIPALDVLVVMIRRVLAKQSVTQGDRRHLHFQLQATGFGTRGTVLMLYLISALFGLSTLFLQSREKLIALIVLVLIMLMLVILTNKKKSAAVEPGAGGTFLS